MALPLQPRHFEQHLFVQHGRTAQHGTRYQNLVLARELAQQCARRVGEQRKALGKLGASDRFDIGHEIDQDVVEQRDMARPQLRGILEKQFGDPTRGLGAARRIAVADDFIESGDERRGRCHQTCPMRNRPQRRCIPSKNVGNGRSRQFRRAW